MSEFSNPFAKMSSSAMTGKVMRAINENSKERLLQALQEKADIEFSRTDCTPLMVAIQEKRTELALLLIDNNADVTAKNRLGFTILQSAIKNNENEVVQALLRKKVLTNIKDNEGYTPLLTAIQFKNFEALKWLLQENCGIDATINNKTALEYFMDVVDYENNSTNPGVYEVYKLLKAYQSQNSVKNIQEIVQQNTDTANVTKPDLKPAQQEEDFADEKPINRVAVTQGKLSSIKKKMNQI